VIDDVARKNWGAGLHLQLDGGAFAQSLGFAGYPELQKTARDEYRLGATARPVVHDDQLGFSIEEDILTRSLKTDALSLEETISKNTLERFNRASHLLAEARQVLAVGLHEAAVVAQHASYVFELLGIPCLAVTDSTESNVARLSRLSKATSCSPSGSGAPTP